MSIAIDFSEKYTYADYLTWSDEERWELINGYPYSMSAAPSRRHQKVSGVLFNEFYNFFKGKPCEVYIAPFDVRLSEDTSEDHVIENVVQPDLSIFCDEKKLDDKGAIGAPDLVVEILSHSTAAKDMKTKLLLYQQFGVKEYWIVDPENQTIEIILLNKDGKYHPGIVYAPGQKCPSTHFKGLEIDVEAVFAE